jgi:predicted deacylase
MGDGLPLTLPVHVVAGARPGPWVTILALQHGDELHTLGPIVELVRRLDPANLAGTVCAVPIANPIAFEHGHRSTWVDSIHGDGGNMNRAWPGSPTGWLTERMAYALRTQVIDPADCVIDLHDGNIGLPTFAIYYAYYYQTSGDYGQRLRELSLNFGQEIVVKVPVEKWPPYRLTTLDYYCFQQQKPFVCVELGEFWGFPNDPRDRPEPLRGPTEVGTTGLLNTLKLLNMIPGATELPKRQLLVMPERHVRPSHGGLLYSRFGRRNIGQVVPRGTVLGRIINAHTFEDLEELTAPFEQNCLIAVTDGVLLEFARVTPGAYGYLCADYSTAEWVER